MSLDFDTVTCYQSVSVRSYMWMCVCTDVGDRTDKKHFTAQWQVILMRPEGSFSDCMRQWRMLRLYTEP